MDANPAPLWDNIDWSESATQRGNWIAVLPLGAQEQHGPHLPPETDTIIAGGIAHRLIEVMPADLPVTVLPTEPIGYSVEHMDLGNTQSLTYDEAIERWIGIAENVWNRGIRKLVMLNAHGGNSPLMTIVATEARIRFDILAVATSWTRFGVPPQSISDREKAFGIHAGDIETSVMLALRPDLVDMSQASSFHTLQEDLYRDAQFLRAYGPHAFGWKMGDLNSAGAAGNAAAATAEKGQQLIEHSVSGLIALLRDVDAFDVSRFDEDPQTPVT